MKERRGSLFLMIGIRIVINHHLGTAGMIMILIFPSKLGQDPRNFVGISPIMTGIHGIIGVLKM